MIRLDLSHGSGTVEVDGVDLSKVVRSVRLEASAGDVPTVELSLVVLKGLTVTGEAHWHLTPECRDALIALGWTPPPGR